MSFRPAFLISPSSPHFLTSRSATLCRRQFRSPAVQQPFRSFCLPRAALDGLRNQGSHHVNPLSGRPQSSSSGGTEVVEFFFDLPEQSIPELDIETSRSSTGVIIVRSDIAAANFATDLPAVVFLHGFSQRPANYATMLRMLAAQGHVVIAPRVWLFDVVLPGVTVEGAAKEKGGRASMPAKLQTAVLIDAVRCVEYATNRLHAKSYVLLGHSMGGAMALVAARALRNDERMQAVATLAPAVGPTVITRVNELLSLEGNGDLERFASTFGDIPMLLLHGKHDLIVRKKDMHTLFSTFAEHREADAVGLYGEIVRGSHVGFEDSIGIDLPLVRILDIIAFNLLDLIIYGPIELFFKKREQLEVAKEILKVWCNMTVEDGVKIREQVDELDISKRKIAYIWAGFGLSSDAIIAELVGEKSAIPDTAQIASLEDRKNVLL